MTSVVKSEINKIEKSLDKRIPISDRWKIHILKIFKDEITDIEELDDLPLVLKKWSWIYSSPKKVWEVIDLLDVLRASTIFFMVNWSIVTLDLDNEDVIKKKWATLRKRYYRGLYHCLMCNLVKTQKIPAEDVGRGKRAVTMWISPFAKEKDIQKCRDLYLSIGGELGKVKKHKKTKKDLENSADREIEYRGIVKRKHFIERVKKLEKIGFTFYECPECQTAIKIFQDDMHLYNMKNDKLLEPCKCGYKHKKKVVI